jgi:hypothetical protein
MKLIKQSLTLCFLSASILSCNSTNDKMNELLAQKKVAEDSLNIYAGKYAQAKDAKDYDKALQAEDRRFANELKLREINYSIDSLSKLK